MFIGKRRNEMPPHLFAVSDEAYRNMTNVKDLKRKIKEMFHWKTRLCRQTRYLRHLVSGIYTSRYTRKNKVVVGKSDHLIPTGNAKTVRNNNSSRFGKFIRIHFNKAGKLAGADIEHYLLEKSRVIKQAPGERSYHIFYQIYSGAVKGLRERLLLNRPLKDYHFIAQAETTIDGVDDKEEMNITEEAFDIMKFSLREKEELFAITAEGELACKLFQVDYEKFVGALLKPRVKVGTEWVNRGQNLEQVNWALGALAKALFARMFSWLIKRCNKTLDAQDLSRDFFIGVLDIAGFEIFDLNSFEQLWINFVNEKLQQFFNHHMFVLEQEEYQREGIKWEFIDFGLDLQACIELIEKVNQLLFRIKHIFSSNYISNLFQPLGIISMLDEECIVPKATDLTLASKLNDQHIGKHPNFQKPKPPKGKQAEAHLAIVHYAGTVRYNVKDWLEKNKDPLNDTAVTVLKANKGNQLMTDLWADYNTQEDIVNLGRKGVTGKKKGKSASFMTVSMMYRESLNNLMHMLHQTHPHFIRCIIPNEQKKSGVIEANLVLNQLTCNGVLEGIRICRKGFPNRMPYSDFKQRSVQSSSRRERSKWRSSSAVLPRQDGNDQVGLIILQRNVRAWCTLRSWNWFKLYGRVKPLIKGNKKDEEFEALEKKLKELEEVHTKEERKRKNVEAENARLQAEKQTILIQLEQERDANAEIEERSAKLLAQKADLEKQNTDLNEQLADQEDRNSALIKAKKKVEQDNESIKKTVSELEMTIKKQENEKQGKEHQIRSLQDEVASQDELIAKINKEKKHQEEINRKLLEDIQVEEDKVNHLSKIKAKLESTLDEVEDNLEREKRNRQDSEKQKRKIAQETIEELTRRKHEQDNIIKKKEAEIHSMTSRLEDEQSLVSKLQRQIKELLARIQELEEELEAERQSRSKAEKARNEMQMELEELGDRLDEAGGATQAQMELNKKGRLKMSRMCILIKGLLAKLRRDLEDAAINSETTMTALRKKHSEGIAELSDQLDTIQKLRAKVEKEKIIQQKEIEDLQSAIDSEAKHRQNCERLAKQLEAQLTDMTLKSDEQARVIQELTMYKNKMHSENSDLNRQLEDAESQLAALNRIKQQIHSQSEELKRQLDQETRERQALQIQSSNYQLECEQLREALEEEQDSKTELQRLISKANAETQQWRTRFEGEGMNRAEELEEARRKLASKVQEVQEQLESANQKVGSLEKTRQRLVHELEDAQVDADRLVFQANAIANSLEKKQKGFDKIVDEWKRKCEALVQELEASQRDTRSASTETFRLRNQLEESAEQNLSVNIMFIYVTFQIEGVRRENKILAQELKDITDQLGEGGKSVHDLQKLRRRLEMEKEELQRTNFIKQALDDAEAALEAEESKVLRAQVEVSQIRSEIEKRLQEKEEEFENTRKNHQRALESMQASLESESRGRAELLRMKKKLESDINELEIALDHANKANVDTQKNLKRHQDNIRDLQAQVEEEQRVREEARDQASVAERRAQILQQEKEELAVAYEQSERQRRQIELESVEAKEAAASLTKTNAVLGANKRKLEGEIQQMHAEMNEALGEMKNAEERAKKSSVEVARLADDLRAEQEHLHNVERIKKGYESQIKDMQARLDEAEAQAQKGGKRALAKLDARCRELENELDAESRRHSEAAKNLRNKDRRCRELQFQVDEDKKTSERMYDLIEKLQSKIKTYKRQVEDAETLATQNLTKYRQLQHALEDAEERADVAENSLAKMRMKTRSGSLSFGIGLAHSVRFNPIYL
uniref:Myosin motor domain-containing protein n=1 Tax=Heterorhabditis bacteriophora TaxID=37862 RepID=A0A1I7XLC0_HETBA